MQFPKHWRPRLLLELIAPLAALLLIHMLALASPGPNVLLVTHISAKHGRAMGTASALGIATGAAVWAFASLLGVSLLFDHVGEWFWVLRLFGASYLIVLGVKLWRSSGSLGTESFHLQSRDSASRARRYWLVGLATTLSNPKAALFFASIFTAVLPVDASDLLKGAAVGLVIVDSMVFHVGMAQIFSYERVQVLYRRLGRRIDRLAGVAMASLGLRLALESK